VIARDGRWGIYLFGGDLFALDLSTSVINRITRTAAREKSPRLSPDGTKLAFVREGDLYTWDLEKGVERRLTSDGSDTLLNGTLSWVYWEEVFARRDLGYWWSEDSTALAYLRTDESAVTEMIYQGFEPNIPALTRQRYPKTGGVNPSVRLGVLELASGKTTWVDLSKHKHEYIVRVKWLNDSRRLAVQTMDRSQTRLDLFFVGREEGSRLTFSPSGTRAGSTFTMICISSRRATAFSGPRREAATCIFTCMTWRVSCSARSPAESGLFARRPGRG
jgi:dipeptidyl-peptidase-4